MPFMDHELAAFVSGLPDEWRVRGLTTKRILREAMRRVLPAAILERPKIGFRVPVNEWFRGSMRGLSADHLLGAESRTRDYYDPQALRGYLDEHTSRPAEPREAAVVRCSAWRSGIASSICERTALRHGENAPFEVA